MLICTAVFCLQLVLPRMLEPWLGLWSFNTGLFWPWQIGTYAFLHGDFLSLFFNMLSLWMFGAELERTWGPRRYMQMLAASAVLAGIAALLVNMLLGMRGLTIGQTGVMFGLLLAWGLLFPDRVIMMIIPPVPMKARTAVIVFAAIALALNLTGPGGLAGFGQLVAQMAGGMLGAWLMISFWRGRSPFGRGKRR